MPAGCVIDARPAGLIFCLRYPLKTLSKSPYSEGGYPSDRRRIMQQVNRSEELIPVQEKYALTIREASEYFSIGIKKMRRLAEDNLGRFAIYSGTATS